MFDDLKEYVILGLIALCGVLGIAAHEYKHKFFVDEVTIATQNKLVEKQKADAAAELDQLKQQVAATNKLLQTQHDQQDQKDKDAQAHIDSLAQQLATAPIRVRYVSVPTGSGGGCTSGGQAAANGSGQGDAPEAYGVLPAANSSRLIAVAKEAEEINQAYAACRATLLGQ